MGAQAHFATQSAKPNEIVRQWFVIDAEDVVLGRLSTRVASVLKGKHRPFVTPHVDCGDHVIVVNCEKVKLTGRKAEQKTYHRHSGYTGSIKSVTAEKLLAGPHADRVVRKAVQGMLPKNTLGRQMLSKLRVYAGPDHPHTAQKPEELSLA
jgi:large subunit ribosomal protein L13